ncbi:MAG: Gfo/Idh/MocA family oxidoreductase [Armatimonadota bacterium]|nr:Gfo/Idh/MocA family oxidoreductase [Armatimonadota bacterium]
MGSLTRRRLLEDALLAAAAAAAARLPDAMGAEAAVPAAGPNDQIGVAIMGCGGRGMGHLAEYLRYRDVAVVAVCDPDQNRMAQAVKACEKAGKPAPKTYADIRRLLEDKDVDAVSIATCNHWHALGAIWCMQAGKDCYVEKPISHNVLEGRRMVEAAAKYGRVCQSGTQCRANPGIRQAMEYLHAGKLGKISLGRGLCYKPRGSIGPKIDPVPPPAGVDYNLWLGPAPEKPITRRRFHYDWHWFWDYGNGDLGNQGIHQMDLTRWGLNQSGFPKKVMSIGGRFGYEDCGETPNTHITFLEYDDCQLVFEVRGLKTEALKGAKIGCIFYGTQGVMVIPSYSTATVFDPDGKEVRTFKGGGDHFRNFLDCVRSRRTADMWGPVEEGHVSSALCHLGNISHRLGTPQPFNQRTQAFGDNKEAYECLARFEEHLKENGVPIDGLTYSLGRPLRVDPAREAFVGDEEANRLLTREYRKPFVVPDRV